MMALGNNDKLVCIPTTAGSVFEGDDLFTDPRERVMIAPLRRRYAGSRLRACRAIDGAHAHQKGRTGTRNFWPVH